MRKIAVILLLLISHFVSGQTFVLNASVTYNTPVVDTLIGPSIVWAGKTTVFLGDSWVNGIAASDNAHRYTSLFAAGRSTTEINSGVNGVTMSPDSCAGYTNYSLSYIPTYSIGTHCALFINLGLNDIGKNVNYQSSTRFDSAYNAYLNNAINVKGWPDSLVYIFTPGYVIDYTAWTGACGIVAASSSRALAFNAKIQALATTYNCNYVDIYTPMSAALNSSYYDAGKAHLNDAGMAWISDWLETHIRPAAAQTGTRVLVYDDFAGSSLNSRWRVRRPDKQTITVSGGSVRIQTNTDTIPSMVGFDYSNVDAQCMIYDTSYGLTCVRNYTEEIVFKLNKQNDTTIGAFLGVYSPFPLQLNFTNFALAQFSTNDSLKFLAGMDTMFSVPPAFKEALSTFSFNTTDWFTLRNTSIEGTILVTIKNNSTGDSINKYYTRDFVHGSYPSRPNYFWFTFGGMGRTDMNVDYILVTTTQQLDPRYIFVGNSITTGYNATSADSAYANILKRSTTDSIEIYAGGGMGVDEVLQSSKHLLELNQNATRYVFLNLGTNNTYNSPNAVKYSRIVDTLTNAGFTVFPCLIVNGGDPTSGGGWNQFIKTTYASSYIDLWTAGWNTMTIGNGEMYDGVHPTLSGHQKLAALIQTLKPLLFPGSLGYASCPYVLPFETRSNFTENTPGTYTLTSAASDGNATSSITLPAGVDSVYAYFEYQSADGFQSAISWDTISTQSTPYYSQCKFNVFVFAAEYWTQYNQEGAINATVSAVDGDLVGLIRRGTTIYAAYYRGGLWHNLVQFTGSHNTTLYQYISSSNDGSTSLKLRNLKYCIY